MKLEIVEREMFKLPVGLNGISVITLFVVSFGPEGVHFSWT